MDIYTLIPWKSLTRIWKDTRTGHYSMSQNILRGRSQQVQVWREKVKGLMSLLEKARQEEREGKRGKERRQTPAHLRHQILIRICPPALLPLPTEAALASFFPKSTATFAFLWEGQKDFTHKLPRTKAPHARAFFSVSLSFFLLQHKLAAGGVAGVGGLHSKPA